jgi:hypothetical protein
LEEIFKQASSLYDKSKFSHTTMVELSSVVERALNYMHTGNTAVLATTVMNPLWIARALVKDGFPCINTDIIKIVNYKHIIIDPKLWPFDETLHRPYSSSRRSHTLTYGEPHFNVSSCSLLLLL